MLIAFNDDANVLVEQVTFTMYVILDKQITHSRVAFQEKLSIVISKFYSTIANLPKVTLEERERETRNSCVTDVFKHRQIVIMAIMIVILLDEMVLLMIAAPVNNNSYSDTDDPIVEK